MTGKRRSKSRFRHKRILSSLLSVLLASTAVTSMGSIYASADDTLEQTINAADYRLMDNCQDGTILHCFDWKYTDIIDELPNIAAAGFTSVQTSPAQPGGNHDPDADYGTWWWLYQPLSFSIGKNYLGTKDELQQLCTEAEKYGIKIIVDIVANHLAGDHTYIQDDLKPDEYWHAVEDWNSVTDKRHKTTHKDLGMPDIASENTYVQECVRNYIQELKEVGVDGLRWDTLKHIQVPSENCTFFTYVLDPEMYNYGESLGDPGGNDDAQNRALMQEYTGLMSVTDDVYGRELRNAFNDGRVPTSTGNWMYRGVSEKKLVYWGESHDTWSNGKDYGYSNEMDQNVIDRAYAIAASRSGSTVLYFSRPSETEKDLIFAGVKGSTHFTSPEVAAVNHFHNDFNGRSEYLSSWGDIACNERGTKGMVLVNAKGNGGYVNVPVYRMENGTYTDQVTGNQFTVSNGYISGIIGPSGIAVVYNVGDVGVPPVKPDTLYLQPNDNWKQEDASFAMYLFNNTVDIWVSMAEAINGIYSAAIPEGDWEKVIFVRKKPNSANNWENKWNQTNDLLIPTDGTNEYSITSSSEWNGNIGSWVTYTNCAHIYGDPIWTWNGTLSASAAFVCTKQDCDHVEHVNAALSRTASNNAITITATVSFNGTEYTNTKNIAKDGNIYLTVNSNWPKDGARFAACFSDGSTESWIDLTETDNDGVYSGAIPSGSWSSVTFCRMNPAKTDNIWNNKWNASSVQSIPTNGDNCYTVESGAWNSENGTWSLFENTITYYNVPAKAATCTEAGNIEYYIGSNGKYYTLSDGTYTNVSYDDVIIPAQHSYSEPTWQWANDYSSATVSIVCSKCGENKTHTAEVTDSYVGGFHTFTAAATVDGIEINDVKTDYNIDESFLSKCEAYKNLTNEQKTIYRDLLEFARNIIAGNQASSVFTFSPEIKPNWTSEELGIASNASANDASNAFQEVMGTLFSSYASNYATVLNALLADCPYEFYWYAKTSGTEFSLSYNFSISGGNGNWNVSFSSPVNYISKMSVSLNYKENEDYTLNTEKIRLVRDSIPAAAQRIVDEAANKSDYQKLKYYAEAICTLTDYNDDAAYENYNTIDQDPWQLVYVFDGDDDTKVVCEGYSKAFKYLCDITDFSNNSIKCYLVSGTLSSGNNDSGPHMWNIISINGTSYLVDVTNSDPCTGRDGSDSFLLNGGTITQDWYQIISRNSNTDSLFYYYDDETNALWTSSILSLSSSNYNESTATIRWVNYDGSLLAQADVSYGQTPVYPGESDPEKPADSEYTYTFSGWSPEVSPVNGNAVYTAVYTPVPLSCSITINAINCKVTAHDVNGTTINSGDSVPYNSTIVYDIEADYGYYIENGETHVTRRAVITEDTTISITAVKKNYRLIPSYDPERGNAPSISGSDLAPYMEYITVTAGEPKEGYEFAGWTYLDRKLISTEKTITVQMTSNIKIRANYRKTQGMVSFKANGQLYKEFVGDSFTEADYPDAPSAKLGYKFIGWNKTADEINNAIKTGFIEVEAIFEIETKEAFTVTIKQDGAVKETKTFTQSTVVTETAGEIAGKTFAYWELDGNVFTYNPTISIMAVKSCTIEAVYTTDGSNAEEKGTAMMISMLYDNIIQKLSINVYLTIPENAVISKAGLVASFSENFDPATQVLTSDNAQYVRSSVSAEGQSATVNYTWNLRGVPAGKTIYARAYLVYTLDGKIHTVYGELESITT